MVQFSGVGSERFNGRLRDECLNVEWFVSLADAAEASKIPIYNHERLHGALADRTPAGFAELYGDVSAKASASISSGPRGGQGLALESIGRHDTRALAWIIHEVSSQKRKDALKG